MNSHARSADQRLWLAAAPVAVGAVLAVLIVDAGVAAILAVALAATAAARARMWWLAACAVAWVLVFLAVLLMPGPYDSWAGRAVVPVLAGYAATFLAGWAIGRRVVGRATQPRPESRQLAWPSDKRLQAYLLILLVVAVVASVIRFRGMVPPLFADNPDAARQVLRERSNIVVGLLSQAWTLGMAISLLRALTRGGRGSIIYFVFAVVFTFGAALGASKNSVLVGVIPALVAVLSVRRPRRHASTAFAKTPVIVLIGAVAVGGAVFLGGQRTLAGTGAFETEFRARYGDSAWKTSAGSLDLSLSSSAETFGRLWAQRERLEPAYGAYSLLFLGSRVQPIVGKVDLYGTTSQLSLPYYMNTATFVAIPLLDYGPLGAALFLAVLGVAVGMADRRLEFSTGPAQQLGRGLVIYFAVFGIYELYPFIQPIWVAIVPGLWLLYRLGRPRPA